MIKRLSKLVDIILFIVVVFMMISAFGNFAVKKPLLMSSIRSNSMFPLFQRGDVIFLKSLDEQDNKKVGDIVVFRDMEGDLSQKGYIVHRLHDGSMADGFITKGDNNSKPDQELGNVPRIKNEWIYSDVICFNDQPLKIPLLGFISLFVIENGNADNIPKLIAAVVLLIIIVEVVSELKKGNKKNRKKRKVKKGIDLLIPSLISISLGLLLSILVAAASFTMSKNFSIFYGVSETSAVLQNSNIGSIAIGDSTAGELTSFKNNGLFPLIIKVYSSDPQVRISENNITLLPSQELNIQYEITAQTIGLYDSKIFVGIFFPLLPPFIAYLIGRQSFWPIIIVIATIPALPLYLYPLFSTSQRRNIKKYLASIF